MKKMLPNQDGTSIPSSWEEGDYVVIYESWKLENIYNMDDSVWLGSFKIRQPRV